MLSARLVRGELFARQQRDVGRDDVQQVVEVVRDAAREPADRVELLHLPHLLLEPGALGDVAEVGLRDAAAADGRTCS